MYPNYPNKYGSEIEAEIKFALIGKLVRHTRHSAYPQYDWSYRGLVKDIDKSSDDTMLWVIINVTSTLEEILATTNVPEAREYVEIFWNEELIDHIVGEEFSIGISPPMINCSKKPFILSILGAFEVLDNERDLPTLLES
jgi:hypothetical protein